MDNTSNDEKTAFMAATQAITGNIAESLDDEFNWRVSVSQYATDLILAEWERRGFIGEHNGGICIPFYLPDGIDFVEPILTRQPSH